MSSDLGVGTDNLFKKERYRTTLRVSVTKSPVASRRNLRECI